LLLELNIQLILGIYQNFYIEEVINFGRL